MLWGRWGLTALAPQNHLQILLLLVFEAMVYRSQDYHRRRHQLAPLPAQAVCAEGTRQRLDHDLPSCLKYYVNFFFYKFGLEVRWGSTLAPSMGLGSTAGGLATLYGAFAEQRLEGMGEGADQGGRGPQLEVGLGLGSTLSWGPHLDSPSMETCLASLLVQESGLGRCPHPGHNTLCPPRPPRGRARRTPHPRCRLTVLTLATPLLSATPRSASWRP